MITPLSHTSVYKNRWTEVFEDTFSLPNGTKGLYGYVERANGADVVIVNDRQEVLLVKQYRYPIKDFQWGIPGGGIDEGESPDAAVRREVMEETGLHLTELQLLGSFYPLSSCSTEKGTLFLARTTDQLPPLNPHIQDDELFAEMKFVSFAEALRMIDEGEITDAASAHAIQMAERKLRKMLNI